jgi:methylenetetrahydrofolate dehydrogenase (NADP+)/methenyltetrahydrofolate cyclohydrolase
MTAKLIEGKSVAAEVERETAADIESLRRQGIRPTLVTLRVGEDPASELYVKSKVKKAEELGLNGVQRHVAGDISEADLEAEIERLNRDDEVDGILLQLPLPSQLNSKRLLDLIDPAKDVDGFHPINVGNLQLGRPALAPCTPAGCIRLIESTGQPIRGKRAVVIGRSDIVGKPVSALLLQRDATVTICHSKTADLPALAREADILVAAIGRAMFVTADMVKPGAIVIDVGINRLENTPQNAALLAHDEKKLSSLQTKGSVVVGDVDFARAKEVAGWITPVPGGVGPMTIAMLIRNTVLAARARRKCYSGSV